MSATAGAESPSHPTAPAAGDAAAQEESMEITLNKEANEPKEAGAFQYELRIDGTPSGWAYRVAA